MQVERETLKHAIFAVAKLPSSQGCGFDPRIGLQTFWDHLFIDSYFSHTLA